jgi:hypothetical protein
MSDAKVRGIVHLIEDTKSYGQKGFRKRTVVLEQNLGRFTNYVPVEFTNDGCDSADSLNVGDEIEIAYRLNGRRWQKDPSSEVKFFLNAEALGFKVIAAKAPGQYDTVPGDPNDELSQPFGNENDAPF